MCRRVLRHDILSCIRRNSPTGRLHLFFDASVSIHKTGQHRFDDPTIQASVFDRLFRVAENLLVRVDPYAGEEIVMRCTKPAPD